MNSGIMEIDVHGMNQFQAIRREYRSHPKIMRVELSMNSGITELILRTLI